MERKNQKTKSVGNGEGSLYKSEKLDCWIYQYHYNGKRQTMKQKKNESVKDFKARVTEIKNKINTGAYIEKCTDTVYSIAEKYITQKHEDGLISDRTFKRNKDTLSELEKTCANFIHLPIQKVTINHIEDAKSLIREYSNSVISKIWTLLTKTFKIALSRRMIPFNLMDDEILTKPISKKVSASVEALTIEENNKLIDIFNSEELNHKYRNIILLQLYTGMRIGEVLALSKDCIDLKNNSITVYRTLTRDLNDKVILGDHTKTYKKKNNSDTGKRTFPMTKDARQIIDKIMKSKITNFNNLLFYNYEKNTFITPSEVNCYLIRLNQKYNIAPHLHTHVLRHTFITRCQEKGLPLVILQSLVGHTKGSSITNNIYTSVSLDFMKNELERIN